MHFFNIFPGLFAVALAAPQQIDFEKINQQLPETTLVIPVTAAPTIIVYDPTAASKFSPRHFPRVFLSSITSLFLPSHHSVRELLT